MGGKQSKKKRAAKRKLKRTAAVTTLQNETITAPSILTEIFEDFDEQIIYDEQTDTEVKIKTAHSNHVSTIDCGPTQQIMTDTPSNPQTKPRTPQKQQLTKCMDKIKQLCGKQTEQNPYRQKRPQARTEIERLKIQQQILIDKKERFYKRSKEHEQRKRKNKQNETRWKEQQRYEEEENYEYRLLLRRMNYRDQNETDTGFTHNPYTVNLKIKPQPSIEEFNTNKDVVRSMQKLNKLHAERKIERQKINDEQNNFLSKVAKEHENAIAA
jgi:hypothetical protein